MFILIAQNVPDTNPISNHLSKLSKITLEQCPRGHCSNVILLSLDKYLRTDNVWDSCFETVFFFKDCQVEKKIFSNSNGTWHFKCDVTQENSFFPSVANVLRSPLFQWNFTLWHYIVKHMAFHKKTIFSICIISY